MERFIRRESNRTMLWPQRILGKLCWTCWRSHILMDYESIATLLGKTLKTWFERETIYLKLQETTVHFPESSLAKETFICCKMLQTSGEHNLRLAASNGYRRRDILSTEEYNLPTHQTLKKRGKSLYKIIKNYGGWWWWFDFLPPKKSFPLKNPETSPWQLHDFLNLTRFHPFLFHQQNQA